MSSDTSCPPADRIRLGDVWVDLQGRRHRVEACRNPGLVLMVPIDHKLEPLAMNPFQPWPWQRITWEGHSETPAQPSR